MALRHRNKRRQWSNDPISRSMRALAGRWSLPLQVMADAFRVTAEDHRRAVEFFSWPVMTPCDLDATQRLMSPGLIRPDSMIFDEAATIDPDAWVRVGTVESAEVDGDHVVGTIKLYPHQQKILDELRANATFTFFPFGNAKSSSNRIEGGSPVTSESCAEPKGLRDRRA